jgi:phospholipid/cholesterol/gamma-HCH transport system substrate-binding protein
MAADSERGGAFVRRQVRVAALAVVALLVLGYAVYRVGGVFDVFARRYELVTLVPDALGLREGAPVTLAGQRIGQVSAIEFIPPERKIGGNNLLVRLAISEEVREQIRADSRAFFRTQGLLGDRFIDIQPGTPAQRVLPPGDTLVSDRTVDVDEFMTQAASAIDSALVVIAGVRDLAQALARGEGTAGRLLTDETLYNEMVATASQLRGTLGEFGRADGTFGRLMRDPALYDNVTAAVARMDTLVTAVLYSDGSLARLLNDDTFHDALLGTVSRADTAMIRVTDFLQRMTEGDGTIQRLFTDPLLYDELLRAIVDVQYLINQIRADPGPFRPDIRIRIF